MKEILRLPTHLERDFIKYAQSEVNNNMKTKNAENSVKARLKQAEKEWADVFAEVFYGNTVDNLLQKQKAEVTAEVIAAKKAEAEKKMQAIVLHLYHTIGLPLNQIAETVDTSIEQVQTILNDSNKSKT